jgi:lipopolysaccharide export system permease protein
MRVLRRYVGRQVVVSVILVLAALLMLFAFFDLIHELGDLGQGQYTLRVALAYVGLSLPGRLYELFPVAVLIGTLFAFAQFVIHSEYAVMRTSGVSVLGFAGGLTQIGLGFALIAFLTGEFLTPWSEEAAQRLRLRQTSSVVASTFRSGLWVKDDESFVNVARILHDATLQGVRIYEFDDKYHLRAIRLARQAKHLRDNRWRLDDVVLTRFEEGRTTVSRLAEAEWRSVLTPGILSVLLVPPDKMSLATLFSYVQHLRDNNQESGRYEIALWNKIVYPFAVLVMMFLALPFAHMNVREGGVSTKIFAGIMLGISFHLLSRLFGHIGALAAWPPLMAALAPTAAFLALAAWLVRRQERR